MLPGFLAQHGEPRRIAREDAAAERHQLFPDQDAQQPDQCDDGRCGRADVEQAE
jgi:hypothetical protein